MSIKTHHRESPNSKRRRIERESFTTAISNSLIDDFAQKQIKNFSNLQELLERVHLLDTKYWRVIENNDRISFCHIIETSHAQPKIIMALCIDTTLATRAYFYDSAVKTLGDFKIPNSVNNINDIEAILDKLKECKNKYVNKSEDERPLLVLKFIISLLQTIITNESFKFINVVKFISEQLTLITMKKVQYSNDILVFSSLLFNCSPQCYRLLRESALLVLPCYSTLRKLTVSMNFSPAKEQSEVNFLMYIKSKIKHLTKNDKTVLLMIDEIHLKANFDYKAGYVVGTAFDSAGPATSAYVFMVSSIKSKFKDVVHIVPTRSMKAGDLFNFIKRVIIGLEEIGLKVVCVITDNNAINSKAMKLFEPDNDDLQISYPHPVDPERPLFFMFDSVHILKCIRNNWIRLINQCMMFPCFSALLENTNILCAPFMTIKKLYALESDLLLKHSYQLSMKAINPSTIERQNVKLVLQIFNEYLIEALLSMGEKCASLDSYKDVAEFVRIITDWWTVMNVKSLDKGVKKRNIYAEPLKKDSDSFKFLEDFVKWMDKWRKMQEADNSLTGLTKETFKALYHTTKAMIKMCVYLKDQLDMDFMLTGL